MLSVILASVLGPWDIGALFLGAVLVMLVFRVSRGRAFSISAGPLKAQVDEIKSHAETAAEAARVAVTATTEAVTSIGESVGTKNGHGTLQDQLASVQKQLDNINARHSEFEKDSREMHAHIMTMAQRASNEEALHAEGRVDMIAITRDLRTLTEIVNSNAEIMAEAMVLAQHNQAALAEEGKIRDKVAERLEALSEVLRRHTEEDSSNFRDVSENFKVVSEKVERALSIIGDPDDEFVRQGRSILKDLRSFHHEWASSNAAVRGWSEVLYSDLAAAREQQLEFTTKVEAVLGRLDEKFNLNEVVEEDGAGT